MSVDRRVNWFEECALRHLEPDHAAEIMVEEERRQTLWFRFLDWLGLMPYRPEEVQCSVCLRWRRWPEEARDGWGAMDGRIYCPGCSPGYSTLVRDLA